MRPATLHVGGLPPDASAALLHAAFLPFGPVLDVTLPPDPAAARAARAAARAGDDAAAAADLPHRGFALVVMADPDDARAAIDNMHWNEILGRPVRVSLAKSRVSLADVAERFGSRAVWTDEDWLREHGYLPHQDEDEDEEPRREEQQEQTPSTATQQLRDRLDTRV